jgi:hypothetical protein
VSEMDARLEHFTHRYSHDRVVLRLRLSLHPTEPDAAGESVSLMPASGCNTAAGQPARRGTLTGADVWGWFRRAAARCCRPADQTNPKVYQ